MSPILVVSFPAIGDFIRSHSAIQVIAEKFPERPIDVVTSSIAAPLAELMPHVRKSWTLNKKKRQLGLADRRRLAHELRAENYGTAYLLTNTAKAAFIPWLARIPERIGYPRELQFGLLNRFPADWWRQLPMMGERHPRLYEEVCAVATLAIGDLPVEGWPAPRLILPPERVEDWRRRSGLDQTKPVLTIYASALEDRRVWPIERFVAVAADYVKRGWSVRLVGAAREREAAGTIRAAVPEVMDLTSTPLLVDAMCQIATSTMFLGVDGGPAHAAAALGVPTVLIFRANHAFEGCPVNRGVRAVEPPISTPSKVAGTLGISVDQVLEALEDTLRNADRARGA